MKIAKRYYSFTAPQSWCDMFWGEYFRDSLTQHLQPFLGKVYGYHMLKIGNLSAEIHTQHCAITHQVNVGIINNNVNKLQVIADMNQLPFASKSIDACLLFHTLEWNRNPHCVLREIDRVLIDNGWVIISSFNPFSLLGISRGIPGLHRQAPWNGRMFTQMRLLDWLNLLNYEVLNRISFQVVPWYRHDSKITSTYLPSLGCLNIIMARKRTFPLTVSKIKKNQKKSQLFPIINVTKERKLVEKN